MSAIEREEEAPAAVSFAPVRFAEIDPKRPLREAALRALGEDALREAWRVTQAAARQARAAGRMEDLYALTRGTKTLQRIAGERGILDLAKR